MDAARKSAQRRLVLRYAPGLKRSVIGIIEHLLGSSFWQTAAHTRSLEARHGRAVGWCIQTRGLSGSFRVAYLASLFTSMLMVGLVVTVAMPGGFAAVSGLRRKVLLASSALLASVAVSLAVEIAFLGNVKFAAVLPVIGLSCLNCALQWYVRR